MTKPGEEIPAIYVVEITDNNTSHSKGRWIEIGVDTTVDAVRASINEMLDETGQKKYRIDDYRNIPSASLDGHPKLEDVIKIAKAVQEEGYRYVKAYLSLYPIDELEQLDDRFIGTYSSVADYAYERADEWFDVEQSLGSLDQYVDYAALTHAMAQNDELYSVEVGAAEIVMFRDFCTSIQTHLATCFDSVAFARDLELCGDISTAEMEEGGIGIFRTHF